MNCCKNCKRFLQIQTLTVADNVLNITVAQQNLIDGSRYCLAFGTLAFPVLNGSETVVITNGTQTVTLTDYRAREILSERITKQCEKLFMQYTANSVNDAAIFRVLAGIVPLP